MGVSECGRSHAGRVLDLFAAFQTLDIPQVAGALGVTHASAASTLTRLEYAGQLHRHRVRTVRDVNFHPVYTLPGTLPHYVQTRPYPQQCRHCRAAIRAGHGCPCPEAAAIREARAAISAVQGQP